ncbi:MAG: 50S ribosomal protein L23 [Porticoccaceae bacterium]
MNPERIYQVLLAPHVSEKATNAAEAANQIVFRVARGASKAEVRTAVETLFKVQVEHVRVLVVKGKTRRTRHGIGQRSDWKKAYVRLAPGHDIDFTAIQ